MNEWLSVRFDRTKKGKRVIERDANWKASILFSLLVVDVARREKNMVNHPTFFSLETKKERATTTQVRLPLLLFEGSRTAEGEGGNSQ